MKKVKQPQYFLEDFFAKYRKNLTFFFLIFISLFWMTSCVTIATLGGRKYVKVQSKPSGANVFVNEEKVGTTPFKVHVERKKSSEIKIEKEGYTKQYDLLYPASFNYASCIDVPFAVIPYYVDVATGAAFRLNKNSINATLTKIPEKINKKVSASCDEIKFKFKAGDKVGNVWSKKQPIEILYFEKTITGDAVHFKEVVEQNLEDFGFEVPKQKKSVFGKSYSDYLITGEIKDVKYNIYKPRYSGALLKGSENENKCEIAVIWKISDKNKNVLFEKSTSGVSIRTNPDAVFDEAFEKSIYEFFNDKKTYSVFVESAKDDSKAISSAGSTSSSFSEKPIEISKPHAFTVDEEINDASSGVITIENEDGHGSGFIISSDGYAITNAHVTQGVSNLKVRFKDGTTANAKLIRESPEADLALIKIEKNKLVALALVDKKEIKVGTDIFAIGTPTDKELGQSVTRGIISGSREVEGIDLIQTDAAINAGNSGGPLVNKKGIAVGVVNMKIIGDNLQGLGFAIPTYYIFEKLNIKYKK